MPEHKHFVLEHKVCARAQTICARERNGDRARTFLVRAEKQTFDLFGRPTPCLSKVTLEITGAVGKLPEKSVKIRKYPT